MVTKSSHFQQSLERKICIYMNQDKFHTDPEEVRKELQKVADELGLPITDCRVAYAWSEKGNSYNKHVSDELMVPLYFSIRE